MRLFLRHVALVAIEILCALHRDRRAGADLATPEPIPRGPHGLTTGEITGDVWLLRRIGEIALSPNATQSPVAEGSVDQLLDAPVFVARGPDEVLGQSESLSRILPVATRDLLAQHELPVVRAAFLVDASAHVVRAALSSEEWVYFRLGHGYEDYIPMTRAAWIGACNALSREARPTESEEEIIETAALAAEGFGALGMICCAIRGAKWSLRPLVARLLESPTRAVRKETLAALRDDRQYGARRGWSQPFLRHRSADVRAAAVSGIEDSWDHTARDAARAALRDSDAQVRAAGREWLAKQSGDRGGRGYCPVD